MPRSAKEMPEPSTRALTTLVTRTSPAAASAATRAPTWTARPETESCRCSTSPVCRPTRGRWPEPLPLVQARHRLPSRRLLRPWAGRRRGDLLLLRLHGREPYTLAMVHDLQRFAVLQQVTGQGVVDLHPQALAPDEEAERQPGEPLGEARRE